MESLGKQTPKCERFYEKIVRKNFPRFFSRSFIIIIAEGWETKSNNRRQKCSINESLGTQKIAKGRNSRGKKITEQTKVRKVMHGRKNDRTPIQLSYTVTAKAKCRVKVSKASPQMFEKHRVIKYELCPTFRTSYLSRCDERNNEEQKIKTQRDE